MNISSKKNIKLFSRIFFFILLLAMLVSIFFINTNVKQTFAKENPGSQPGSDIEPPYTFDKLNYVGNNIYEFDMKVPLLKSHGDFSWVCNDNDHIFKYSSSGENSYTIKKEKDRWKATARIALNYVIPEEIRTFLQLYPNVFELSYTATVTLKGYDAQKLWKVFIGALKGSKYFNSSDIVGHHTSDYSGFVNSHSGNLEYTSRDPGTYTTYKEVSATFTSSLDISNKYLSFLYYHYTDKYANNQPREIEASVSNFKLKLKKKSANGLTKPHIQDNENGVSSNGKMTSSDYDIFGTNYDNIASEYSKLQNDVESKLDSVQADNNKAKINMISPASKIIEKDGRNCYKWTSFIFEDWTALNDEMTAKFINPPQDYKQLKALKIGDETVQLTHDKSSGIIKVDGEDVGQYEYEKIGSKVRLTLYLTKNADFEVIAINQFDAEYSVSCKFDGIHQSQTITGVSDTDFASSDHLNSVKEWLHSSTNGSFDVTQADDDSGFNMFYYAISRSNDGNFGSANSFDLNSLKGKMPIGYGTMPKISYDAATGFINGKAPIFSSGGVTQTGYYRVEIVSLSLGGGISGVKTVYFKLDKDEPTTTIKKMVGDTNEVVETADNEKWFNKKMTVEFLLTPNISGNYIEYTFGDEQVKLYFKNNKITGINETKNLNETQITQDGVQYRIEQSGTQTKITAIFGDIPNTQGVYPNVNIKSEFKTYVGENDEHPNPLFTKNTEWGNKVCIRVDRTAPGEVSINDEDEIASTTYNDAKWYTDKWIKKFEFELNAEELGSSLGEDYKDITFYAGIAKGEFPQHNGNNLDDVYTSLQDGDVDNYFSKVLRIKGSQIKDSFSKDFDLDLGDNSYGNRTMYFWIKDQAGNVGALHKRYLKVDPTQYQLRTEFYRAGLVENSEYVPEMQFVNEEGDEISVAKRGEKIKVTTTLSDKLASYKLSTKFGKTDSTAVTQLLEQPAEHFKSTYFHPSSLLNLNSPLSGIDESSFTYDLGFGDETKKFTDGANGVGNEQNVIRFKYEYKKIVSYQINTFVSEYLGENFKLNTEINEDVESELEVLKTLFETSTGIVSFATKDGVPVVGKINVGQYKVKVSLENASQQLRDAYIIDPLEHDYTVLKRNATVRVKSNLEKIYKQSMNLNDPSSIAYEIQNLIGEDAEQFNTTGQLTGLNGTVKLATTTAMEDLNVGLYKVIADQEFDHQNYQFKFVEGNLNVKPFEINVRPKDATKTYRDNDSSVQFEVDDIANITDIISNIEAVDVTNRIYKGKDNQQVILRNSGEDVGEYLYRATAINFETNPNYKVKVDISTGKFTITKRNIFLTPKADQGTKVRNESDITEDFINSQTPEFDLDDSKFNGELEGTLGVKWDASITGTNREYDYELKLTEALTKNFNVTLAGTEKYKVEVIGDKVIVRNKARLEYVYGDTNDVTYLGNEDKFEFDGVDITGKTVTLTWDSIDYSNKNAGVYSETVANPQLTIDGVIHEVVCEPINIEVKQRVVDIKPTVANDIKEYGAEDSEYGIGYETLTDKDGGVLTVNSGSLGRMIQGEETATTKFDDITDSNGYIYNTDKKYVIGVTQEFVLNNPNYRAELKEEKLLYIAKKKLNIEDSGFIGKNKVFDNTAKFEIDYETEKIYNLTVVRPNEAYLYARETYYAEVGSDEQSSSKGAKDIIFKQISLRGEKAYNYQILKNGQLVSQNDMFRSTGHTIEDVETIKLKKGWFSVNKQYDGTNEVNNGDVSITQKLLSNLEKQIINASKFSSERVGTQAILNEVKFLFKNVDASAVTLEIASGESDISVEYEGSQWIVTVKNIQGKIIPREITPNDLDMSVEGSKDFTNITREYNATKSISIEGTLKNQAGIYQGVQLTFEAETESKDVGEYTISVTNIYSNNENFTAKKDIFTEYFLRNKVTITKAKLLPEIIFRERGAEYNGTTNLDVTDDENEFERDKSKVAYVSGNATVKSEKNIPIALQAELSKIKLSVLGSFTLSKDGIKNKDVNFEGEKEIYHDFIINQLKVKQIDGNYEDFMKNFELFGGNIYSYDGSTYSKTSEAKDYDLSQGEQTINNIEYKNVMILKRKRIVFTDTALRAKDKIFDGYNQNGRVNAEVEYAQGDTFAVGEEDKVEIGLRAVFRERNVKRDNNNQPIRTTVMVGVLGLRNKEDMPAEDYKRNYILEIDYSNATNFEFEEDIKVKAFRTEAILKPAPVVVNDFNLEEKQYDASAVARTIEPKDIVGLLDNDNDKDGYKVTVQSSTYASKDVELDRDGNPTAKSGIVYNAKIERKKSGNSNYILAYIDNDSTETPYFEKNGNKYYLLPVSTRFIREANYNESLHADKVVGKYFHNGEEGYLVKSGVALGAVATAIGEVNYAGAMGKITKAKIRVNFEIKTDSDMYDPSKASLWKYYDGTKSFAGHYGSDFQFKSATLKGNDTWNETDVDIVAEFRNQAVGRTDIVLKCKFKSNTNPLSNNYDFDELGTTINGWILAPRMNITVKNIKLQYGHRLESKHLDNKYTILKAGGVEVELKYIDNIFYMPYDDYKDLFKQEPDVSLRYGIVDGNPIQEDAGGYVKLDVELEMSINSNLSNNQKVGVSKEFTVYTRSTENKVEPRVQYEGGVANGTVTIVKAKVYVSPVGTYKYEYGSGWDKWDKKQIKLLFSQNENDEVNGLVGGDNAENEFSNYANLLNDIKFYKYSPSNPNGDELDARPKYVGDLEDGEVYRMKLPDGFSSLSSSKYDVVMKDVKYWKGGGLEVTEAQLKISQKKELEFYYNGETALEQAKKILNLESIPAEQDGIDEVTFKFTQIKEEGNTELDIAPNDPLQAGDYFVEVTLVRRFKDDPNNYAYKKVVINTRTDGKPGAPRITIKKSQIHFKHGDLNDEYKYGGVQDQNVRKLEITDNYKDTISADDFEYKWEKRVGSEYVEEFELGVGAYRVVYTLKADKKEFYQRNFTNIRYQYAYEISPKIVTVKIKNKLTYDIENREYVLREGFVGETNPISIETETESDGDKLSDIFVQYYKYYKERDKRNSETITKPGRYLFDFMSRENKEITRKNIEFRYMMRKGDSDQYYDIDRASRFAVELHTNSVKASNGSSANTIGETQIVASELYLKQLVRGADLEGTAAYATIDNIFKHNNMKLTANNIYKVRVKDGERIVELNGNMKYRIKVGRGTDKTKLYKYSNGQLEELKAKKNGEYLEFTAEDLDYLVVAKYTLSREQKITIAVATSAVIIALAIIGGVVAFVIIDKKRYVARN